MIVMDIVRPLPRSRSGHICDRVSRRQPITGLLTLSTYQRELLKILTRVGSPDRELTVYPRI